MVKLFFHWLKETLESDTAKGVMGTGMAVGIPFMEFCTKTFQFLGAFGGLILLYYAIRHKILEVQKLKKENEKNGHS